MMRRAVGTEAPSLDSSDASARPTSFMQEVVDVGRYLSFGQVDEVLAEPRLPSSPTSRTRHRSSMRSTSSLNRP